MLTLPEKLLFIILAIASIYLTYVGFSQIIAAIRKGQPEYYSRTNRPFERIREAFGTYLDREVAEHILKEGTSLVGEEVEVTVMFTDIRDFTGFAERSDARQVVATLNRLFALIVPIVHAHGGRIDVSSSEAKGTTVVIELPIGEGARPSVEGRQRARSSDVLDESDASASAPT